MHLFVKSDKTSLVYGVKKGKSWILKTGRKLCKKQKNENQKIHLTQRTKWAI